MFMWRFFNAKLILLALVMLGIVSLPLTSFISANSPKVLTLCTYFILSRKTLTLPDQNVEPAYQTLAQGCTHAAQITQRRLGQTVLSIRDIVIQKTAEHDFERQSKKSCQPTNNATH